MILYFVSVSISLLACVTVTVVNAWDNNINRIGIGQQGGGKLATSSYVHSFDLSFGWNSTEVADNVWDFSSLEQSIEECIAIHSNISLIMKPQTGNYAPVFMYYGRNNSHGTVPVVWLEGKTNQGPGPWPYYLDRNYQFYFQRFIRKIYAFIVHSKYYPANIFVTQAEYGTTGDDSPWHGTPINSSYAISNEEWWAFSQNMSLYFYDVYYHASPATTPNLLVLYNFHDNDSMVEWVTQNCAGAYQKSGSASHGYQLNAEYDDYMHLGAIARTLVQNGIMIRERGEVEMANTGWWAEAPYWNVFTVVQWYLTYGLDLPNFGGDIIDEHVYDVSWQFFNFFVRYKHANESSGAFIALRDGLDANNTARFPEAIFGAASIQNEDRMKKIARNQSQYGAKQEDPAAACGGSANQRSAKALNDVGFGIWPDNYGKFLEQVSPLQTSQGRWRVGSMNDPTQVYGRFARSLNHAEGKNKMCFVFDRALWGGLPLSSVNRGQQPQAPLNLFWNVTYFDEGTGSWSFEYDSVDDANKVAFSQKKTNHKQWRIKNFNIQDAHFGRRCAMQSDFCIYSADNQDDDIFSFIQVIAV